MLRNGEGQREAVTENPQLPCFNFMKLQHITYHPSGEKKNQEREIGENP